MGKSVLPDEGDLGDFAPKGEPEMLGRGGSADMGGALPGASPVKNPKSYGEGAQSPEAAAAEFSGVKRGPRYSSMKGEGERVTIPVEGEKSISNRKT